MRAKLMDCIFSADEAGAKRTVSFVEGDEKTQYRLHYSIWREGQEVFGIGTVEDMPGHDAVSDPEKTTVLLSYFCIDRFSEDVECITFIQKDPQVEPEFSYLLVSEDNTAWTPPAIRAREMDLLTQAFNLHELFSIVRSMLKN